MLHGINLSVSQSVGCLVIYLVSLVSILIDLENEGTVFPQNVQR
jgi:hypothetical protein